jgi:hypothetical protein
MSLGVSVLDQVLHVREVFTTESFLNIIIPEAEEEGAGGQNDSALGVWAIPPRQEKEIVKLSFRWESAHLMERSPH